LSIKPLESGRADRLRQKESRWNRPLVVAADTGLALSRSGERAMIGGVTSDGWGSGSLWRVQVCSHDIETKMAMQRRQGVQETKLATREQLQPAQ
jgi:hypothetical protein